MAGNKGQGDIENQILLFRVFEKMNVVSVFHRKTKNSFFLEALYPMIPIILYAIYYSGHTIIS